MPIASFRIVSLHADIVNSVNCVAASVTSLVKEEIMQYA